jgi:tRNA(Leu) C34 or U34 (ribose-2'-O)-methylase TrmL
MLNIALYRPEIPPNTGNIARLCVGIQAKLHIVGKPSFDMSEKAVRRAGLGLLGAPFIASTYRLGRIYGDHS